MTTPMHNVVSSITELKHAFEVQGQNIPHASVDAYQGWVPVLSSYMGGKTAQNPSESSPTPEADSPHLRVDHHQQSHIHLAAQMRNLTPGALHNTQNPLDIALQESLAVSYFALELPNGDRGYTRAGRLKTNANGELETATGYKLADGIALPEHWTDLNIDPEGMVSVQVDGQTQTVGQIHVHTFMNPQGLSPLGDNIFRETPASGPPLESKATLRQNHLEKSNVDSFKSLFDVRFFSELISDVYEFVRTYFTMKKSENHVLSNS